jgi:Flp pilus assembly protein TadG
MRKAFPSRDIRFRLRAGLERLRADRGGTVTLELALLLPAILMLLGAVVLGGQGLEIERKVTMTMRTLTDLASQQTNIGTSSTTYTYTQILNAAALVMAPYNSTGLTMVLSEVKTAGTGTGTVVWSQATGGASALSVGATVTVPANQTTSSYMIIGTVTYSYSPLNVYLVAGTINLSNSIAMAPVTSSGTVACCN